MDSMRMMASRTRPWGLESREKDGCSMGSKGSGRNKEKEKDTRTTESKDNVATVTRQWRQKACWYFITSQIKYANAWIPL
jgi:hypothetical protein